MPDSSSRRTQAPPALSWWLRLRNKVLVILGWCVLSSVLACGLLRWLPPPTSMFMLYRHYEDLISGNGLQPIAYQWVNSKHISKHAYTAVVAAEDQRFYQHSGFDLQEIESSIDDYRHGGKLRGASTISQQVAKNLFLTPSKSFIRKGLEVWFTFLIELLWSKDRILEVYLNIAEFGEHLFGIEAASRHYYGIPAKQLNAAQAATLAATLPNPIRFSADQRTPYLTKRQSWIMRQMRHLGWASEQN